MKEWHEDIKVLACLLFLLPTSTSGRNGVSRISTEKALKEIIDFLPPNKQPEIAAKIPKILAQGTSKKDIRQVLRQRGYVPYSNSGYVYRRFGFVL
ncbi:uncharacterized protein DMENIID0001_072890 [Sergentomyia squamirostris]